jgi:EAL domain-containing protein (putative c-di-GMP-specific phosphodiesterase class I)
MTQTEDSGLTIQMSSWVVRAVCRQIRNWLEQGVEIKVAITDRSGDHRVAAGQ